MAWEKKYIGFDNVIFIQRSESGKAILVSMFDENLWIPVSQMEDSGSDEEIDELVHKGVLSISEWIANQKELAEKKEKHEKANEMARSMRSEEDKILDDVLGPPDPSDTKPWIEGRYDASDGDYKRELDEVFAKVPDGMKEKTRKATEKEIEQSEKLWSSSLKLSKELSMETETKKETKKTKNGDKTLSLSLFDTKK